MTRKRTLVVCLVLLLAAGAFFVSCDDGISSGLVGTWKYLVATDSYTGSYTLVFDSDGNFTITETYTSLEASSPSYTTEEGGTYTDMGSSITMDLSYVIDAEGIRYEGATLPTYLEESDMEGSETVSYEITEVNGMYFLSMTEVGSSVGSITFTKVE